MQDTPTTFHTHETDICIVGGGPAGMLLGLLLAKQNIRVLVVEQHQDFAREYRGEVLMPRFSQLFKSLNLLDYIRQFPHTDLDDFKIGTAEQPTVLTFPLSEISPENPTALWMPQPIFLDALYQKAQAFPSFKMWFNASARELIQEQGQTVGITIQKEEQRIEVKASVVVGADGRTSRIRTLGKFDFALNNYKFDLLWFSLPRPENVEHTVQLLATPSGPYIIAPKYPNLIQCGLMTKPGRFSELRNEGISAIKTILCQGPKAFQDFAETLTDFKPFFPLQARLSRTTTWAKPGLLLIGDAAHTCSPIGAIGVSIALETATVAAQVLSHAVQTQDFSTETLQQVQHLREPEVKKVQAIQKRMGDLIARSMLSNNRLFYWLFSLIIRTGLIRNILQRVIMPQTPIHVPEAFRF